MVTVSGNPNPTTKYRCEFVNLFCIYAERAGKEDQGKGGEERERKEKGCVMAVAGRDAPESGRRYSADFLGLPSTTLT